MKLRELHETETELKSWIVECLGSTSGKQLQEQHRLCHRIDFSLLACVCGDETLSAVLLKVISAA